MIIPLYGIISHTRSMTQSRIRGILAGFNRGIKRPINLSAFTAHIRLNMDGLKYLVFHPSRVSPCLGSWAFQFPFHRDRLCNAGRGWVQCCSSAFQFPFHRDRLCNALSAPRTIRPQQCFNSLFIGIGSAMAATCLGSLPSQQSFNSLFIGIGSAILDCRA